MTLGVVWLRNVGSDVFELCVASDSKLTGGTRWDCAQKVFPLPRCDSVLAFAGDTTHAYPLITQTLNYVLSYEPAQNRALDLGHLKGHLGRVIQRMRRTFEDAVSGRNLTCDLILGGFDWRTSGFKVWRLATNEAGESEFHRVAKMRAGPERKSEGWSFHFYGNDDAAKTAKKRLEAMLHRERGEDEEHALDMEPFSILGEIISGGEFDSVGGAPQLVKVFRHMNSRPYNVRWPSADAPAFLFGRELLDYETNRFLVLNPETMEVDRWPPVVGASSDDGAENGPKE